MEGAVNQVAFAVETGNDTASAGEAPYEVPRQLYRSVGGAWRRMICRRHVVLGGLALAGAIAWQGVTLAATPPQGAAQFVNWLADRAIETLRAPGASLEQREAVLRNLLRQGFDLKLIGRFVLGRHWRTATPDQRNDFQQLFEEHVLKTYSYRLGGYASEAFTVISARPAGSKDAMVRTRIDRPSGPPIIADWRIRATNDQYKVIDVMVEGVSMALTQRAEFAAVIKNSGFEGLLAALRARVQKFPAAPAR